MSRRGFLGALVSGLLVSLLSRLPWSGYGAVFKVVYVDPDGSGEDYGGHLGAYIYNAERCCLNCQMIFGSFSPKEGADGGPGFIDHELEPVNARARKLMAEVQASKKWKGLSSFSLAG